ncbi:unnamed protein product [Sphagnum troendelagicum]|uniref:Uncharacterized protein n=1 Tax=Sphagnum troendelagicum TaxID=128251 RepID=A0ABP0U7M8_9BRYO
MFLRRPMDIPAKDWISGNLAAEVSQRARVDADDGSVGDQESSTLDDLKRARKTLRPVLNVVIMSRKANGACMCVQADSSLSVRGEVVQVSRNRICQICGDAVQIVGKGLETG